MFEEKDPQTLPILIESLSTIGSDLFNELEVLILKKFIFKCLIKYLKKFNKILLIQDGLIDSYCDELHMFVTCEDQNIQSAAIATLGTLIKYEKLSKVS